MSSWRSASDGLKVYRVALALTACSMVLLPIPFISVIGVLLFLGASLTLFVGLMLFVVGAPSGVGLGSRLGAVAALCAVGVFLVMQSVGRWGFEAPLLIMGLLCMIAAGVVFQLFWMKAAEAVNAWQVAERFRVPLILGVAGAVISGLLVVAEAPTPVRLIVGGAVSLPGFFTYWSALAELQGVLQFGPAEGD